MGPTLTGTTSMGSADCVPLASPSGTVVPRLRSSTRRSVVMVHAMCATKLYDGKIASVRKMTENFLEDITNCKIIRIIPIF